MLTDFTPDVNLQLKDAGLIAASAAAQVGGSNKILDLGAAHEADVEVHINVAAIEIASNDERYDIVLQGSNSATFASGIVPLAQIQLGALEVLDGDADSDSGLYRLLASTSRGGTSYRYLRLYTVVAGDIATGINSSAWLRPPHCPPAARA
jgi:hypothetical protein